MTTLDTSTPSTPSTTPTRRPMHSRGNRAVLTTEFRLFRREPVPVVWGFVLPVGAFVVLGLFASIRKPSPDLGGASFLAVYQSTLVLFAAVMLALVGLPQVVATYRERGILRRLSTTPMPPSRLLIAQLVIHAGVAVLGAAGVLIVGQAAYGVGPGAEVGGWLLAFALAALALLGLGVLLAAVLPSLRTAAATGSVLFFPMMFTAGLWVPRPQMAPALRTVCDWSPVGAASRAMGATIGGHFPSTGALLVLAGYAVAFPLLAVRLFRWE
jgi:ABC-2 type transport system permease protein